jgi:hypothetical protein
MKNLSAVTPIVFALIALSLWERDGVRVACAPSPRPLPLSQRERGDKRASDTLAQKEKRVPVCRETTFAAFKPLPKLEYDCPGNANDSDDKILKLPQRTRAIRALMQSLEQFNNPAWWLIAVDELNACKIHQSAGELTDDEKQRWQNGDYSFDLFGNGVMRLALIADPCYQTGYNGSNVFLLFHQNGRVHVSQLLNGYYSRVEDSVGIDFAKLNGRQIVEVSTANSMPPSLINYYFEIDPATNKALPKNLFREGLKATNQIYSDMIMGEPKDFGLPKDAVELNVIQHGHLAPSFSAYEESERGRIDANGRKLRRIIYRWNGNFYTSALTTYKVRR